MPVLHGKMRRTDEDELKATTTDPDLITPASHMVVNINIFYRPALAYNKTVHPL